MPVMDGYEANRQIRALPDGDSVKIVALTASVFHESLAGILKAGCGNIFNKPFEGSPLFQLMGKLLYLKYRSADTRCTTVLDFTALKPERQLAIKHAAEALDFDAFSSIIEQIQKNEPQLANDLQLWVDEFRFEQIKLAAGVGIKASEEECMPSEKKVGAESSGYAFGYSS